MAKKKSVKSKAARKGATGARGAKKPVAKKPVKKGAAGTKGGKKPARKAAKKAAKKAAPARRAAKTAAKSRKSAGKARAAAPRRSVRAAKPGLPRRSARGAKAGGTGRERELAQTPEAGRTVKGPTNPMPTKRSTGTASGAGGTRMAPGLDRARKRLREVDESVQGPPSSLDMDRAPSAASSGRRKLRQSIDATNETGPVLTGGDVDADWGDAYAVGDEAPGGDNPTPDQDIVDEIGKALGVEYQDNEELKGADKIAERDKHRWELDPASSDDYRERE